MRELVTLADAATAWRDAEEGLRQAQRTFHGAMNVRSGLHEENLAAYKQFQHQCRVTNRLSEQVTKRKQEVAKAAKRWGELKAAEKKE